MDKTLIYNERASLIPEQVGPEETEQGNKVGGERNPEDSNKNNQFLVHKMCARTHDH